MMEEGQDKPVDKVVDNSHLFKNEEGESENGSKSEEKKDETQKPALPIFQLIITMQSGKPIHVGGCINNPAICFYMLNMAEDVLKNHWKMAQVDQEEMKKRFRKKSFKNRILWAFGGGRR